MQDLFLETSPMSRLSPSTAAKLERIGRTTTNETKESIRQLFEKSGVPPFEPVIEAFLLFGGYCLPFRQEGRFKIARAKAALRMLRVDAGEPCDPALFRIPFGQSERVQSEYSMDGHGHIYEDNLRVAESMAEWVEEWAKTTEC